MADPSTKSIPDTVAADEVKAEEHPLLVTGVTVDSPTMNTLRVSWQPNENKATTYAVEYTVDGLVMYSWYSSDDTVTGTSHVITGLAPYTSYRVRVRATCGESVSPYSAVTDVVTTLTLEQDHARVLTLTQMLTKELKVARTKATDLDKENRVLKLRVKSVTNSIENMAQDVLSRRPSAALKMAVASGAATEQYIRLHKQFVALGDELAALKKDYKAKSIQSARLTLRLHLADRMRRLEVSKEASRADAAELKLGKAKSDARRAQEQAKATGRSAIAKAKELAVATAAKGEDLTQRKLASAKATNARLRKMLDDNMKTQIQFVKQLRRKMTALELERDDTRAAATASHLDDMAEYYAAVCAAKQRAIALLEAQVAEQDRQYSASLRQYSNLAVATCAGLMRLLDRFRPQEDTVQMRAWEGLMCSVPRSFARLDTSVLSEITKVLKLVDDQIATNHTRAVKDFADLSRMRERLSGINRSAMKKDRTLAFYRDLVDLYVRDEEVLQTRIATLEQTVESLEARLEGEEETSESESEEESIARLMVKGLPVPILRNSKVAWQ